MNEFILGMLAGFFVAMCLFAFIGTQASYYAGVRAGYGFCKEPFDPEFNDAGDYLKQYHSRRWPELAPFDDGEDDR